MLISSTSSSVTVEATASFDGGDMITAYTFVRDDGPLTDYQTHVTHSASSHTFEALEQGKMYRFKVAAMNSIG
jgi:hypothetical protein